MTGVPAGTEGIAKFLDVLRNLPLWLFAGLASGTGVLLGVPQIASALPASLRPSEVITCVITSALAVAQAFALTLGWFGQRHASITARKTFHLTANTTQSFWSTAKQSDDSIITQVAVRMLAKNLTDRTAGLASCRLIRPRIRAEVVHQDVSVRSVDRNVYGAAESGHVIPGRMSLPASAHIMIRGVAWPNPKREVRVTIGQRRRRYEQKIRLKMRVMPSAESIAKLRPLELVSDIPDLFERQVAAVLQAEMHLYEKLGRRVGGLGSIHLSIDGKPWPAATTDSWNPNFANTAEYF